MKDRIKICYVGDAQSVHTKKWVEHFSKKGYDVHLISDTFAELDGVTLHMIEGREKSHNFFKRIGQTKRLVKKINPDILHAHVITGYGLFGAKAGFHPFIASPLGSDIVSLPENSLFFRRIVKYVLKKSDIILCGDEFMKKRVLALGGDNAKIRIIPWGMDTETFRPMTTAARDNIRILYLRKSKKVYSIETLLKALPDILKEHGEIRISILKSGPDLERTMNLIKELGLENNIEFIDEVPYKEMPGFLNQFDIFVDTYYSDLPGAGIGMAALEAMSCGLPIIVSNTGGHEPYVQHDVNGIVYKGLDPDSLGKALKDLIEDKNLRDRIGSAARKFMLEKQNWQQNMDKIGSLYEEMITGDDTT